MNLEIEVQSYIGTALWASTDMSDDSGGIALDDFPYGEDKLSDEARQKMAEDVHQFITDNADDCDEWVALLGDGSVGHDLWLTRNRHGAGFWDRFYGGANGDANREPIAIGKRLTDSAHAFGEADLYVGDDGNIYQS